MPDEMRKQLGAYLDGELNGSARQVLQAHLETCPACRAELDGLRQLSKTLRGAPLPADLTPAGRFVDQLVPRLPPRSVHREGFSGPRAVWLVPVGLLTVVVFFQATGALSTLFTLVATSGQLGELGGWLPGGPGQTLWFSAAQVVLQNLLSSNAPANLQVVNDTMVNLQQWLITPLLWQLVVTLAYFGGLAAWWFSRQPPDTHEHVWNHKKE